MVRMGITHFALRSHSQHFPGSSQYGSIQGRDGGHRGGGGGDGLRGSYCYEQVRSLASWTCLVPILPLKNVGTCSMKKSKSEKTLSLILADESPILVSKLVLRFPCLVKGEIR